MKYDIKFLDNKYLSKTLKFLNQFKGINKNYSVREFFVDFFNTNNNKKSLIIVENNKVKGFRGNLEVKYQVPFNNKYKYFKSLESLILYSKSKNKLSLLNLLKLHSEYKISTSVGFGSFVREFFKINKFHFLDLDRYILPLNLAKYTYLLKNKPNQKKLKKWISGISINSKNSNSLNPKKINTIKLSKLWKKISKDIKIFSRFRDKKFWDWRYLNCKYYKYVSWECPKKSGIVIGRVELMLDKKLKKKNFTILRLIEILPSNIKVWKGKKDKNFNDFIFSILNWARENQIVAVDYHISNKLLRPQLFMFGFKLQKRNIKINELSFPVKFKPLNYNHRAINVAWKLNNFKKNFVSYFVKSDGGGDFPPLTFNTNDINKQKNLNLKLINSKKN